MGTMIDTLGYVKRLTAVGVSREQAEAHAEAFRDEIAAQVATKADVDAVGAKLDSKIDKVERRIDAVEHKIDVVEASAKADLEAFRVSIEGKITLLHWMCGFTLAAVMGLLVKSIR
jgi:excinuclease UvrABC ATPase subunit